MNINVGDTFFVFNENRRVYKRDEKWRSTGGPIYREHFEPVKITGETARSWTFGPWDRKVPKKNPWSVLHTHEMVGEKCWDTDNRYKISNAVIDVSTEDLRKVAALIGYTEK